jgi:hypothetical protein
MSHVPWLKELSLFDVNGSSRPTSCYEQIRRTAQKRRNLPNVDRFGGARTLGWSSTSVKIKHPYVSLTSARIGSPLASPMPRPLSNEVLYIKPMPSARVISTSAPLVSRDVSATFKGTRACDKGRCLSFPTTKSVIVTSRDGRHYSFLPVARFSPAAPSRRWL